MLPFGARRHEDGNDVIRIVFSGELDLATLPSAEEHLCRAEADGQLIVVDLRELAFMDLSCLHMIEAVDRRMREGGGRLVIVRGPWPVHRVFELTKLEKQLEIIDHADVVVDL